MTWLTWICVGYVIGFGVTLLAFAIPRRHRKVCRCGLPLINPNWCSGGHGQSKR